MAIANSDGSIILSTKLDTSGVSKGLSDIKNKFAALKDQNATLATLTQAIKDQSYVIKQLSVEYANLVAKGKGTSEQAVELKGKIDTLTAEMKEMEAAATTLGAKTTATFSKMRSAVARFASYFIGIQTIFAAIRFSGEAAEFYAQTEASAIRLSEIYGKASDTVGEFIDQNSKAIGLSKAAAAQFAASYGNIFSAFADQKTNAELTNEFLNLTAVIASKTGRSLEETQEKIKSGLFGNLRAIDDLGIFVRQTALESSEAFRKLAGDRSWEELSSEEQQQIRAYAIMEQGFEKYGKQVLETTTLTRAKFNAAYQDFQNSWGNIVNTFLLPVLETLTQIFDIATKGLNSLSGRSGQILENVELQEENTDKTAENIEQQVENQKDLNKEMKKTIAGFDDIQILSSQTADNTSGGLDSGLQGIGGDLGGIAPDGSAYVEEIDETLTAIMGIVAVSLVAVGLILLFTGNIGWGVGFIIAGAATLTVTMASASEFGYDGIIQMITTIMGVAGGALLALGIILLWIGGVVGTPIAIGMIIAGGALIVSAIAEQAAFSPDDVGSWLSLIMGIAGGALLALGIILCMVGSVPLGVGMIIAGSIGLVSAVALNFDSVKNSITGWVAVIMAIAGAALLVLGIILCATGAALPLGIALIMAGAVALVTPVALNWNAIVDWVKGAWEAVKAFWNKYIAPVFTANFWLNLAKDCGNGLIGGFEAAINGIIGMFEKMINWIVNGLNKISFDVPDWVPGIGGKTFGFNISAVKFDRVSIPRLAQGAVIPPNSEFLAVLGDQKHGKNIEAPLSTIQEAVQIVLSGKMEEMALLLSSSVSVQRDILEAVLGIEIGDDVIGNAVSRYQRKMTIIHGG